MNPLSWYSGTLLVPPRTPLSSVISVKAVAPVKPKPTALELIKLLKAG